MLDFSDRTRTGISKLISRCALCPSFCPVSISILKDIAVVVFTFYISCRDAARFYTADSTPTMSCAVVLIPIECVEYVEKVGLGPVKPLLIWINSAWLVGGKIGLTGPGQTFSKFDRRRSPRTHDRFYRSLRRR